MLLAALLPMLWVGRMVGAMASTSRWRIAGALACTAAAAVVLCGLGAANVALVSGAGRICSAPGVRIAPAVLEEDARR